MEEKKPCCYNCKYMGYVGESRDQPYPEIWCKMDLWHGLASEDELHVEIDCEDYEKED